MSQPESPSAFSARMLELLEQITSARSDWEREQAEHQMADLMKRNAKGEWTEPADFKVAQYSERDE